MQLLKSVFLLNLRTFQLANLPFDGQLVNAEWAIHPQLKDDLKPDEWKEVSELMAQVTGIVGDRFSKILSTAEPDQPGNA